jgi:hypothetical protein
MIDEFLETHIDQENQNDPSWIMQEVESKEKIHNKIENNKMLMLKNNQIPKGLIPLERLFDQNDIPLKYTLQPQPEDLEYCNLGSKESPKFVKLSKYLPIEHNKKIYKTGQGI